MILKHINAPHPQINSFYKTPLDVAKLHRKAKISGTDLQLSVINLTSISDLNY